MICAQAMTAPRQIILKAVDGAVVCGGCDLAIARARTGGRAGGGAVVTISKWPVPGSSRTEMRSPAARAAAV